MRPIRPSHSRAMTLVELMIVVAIIGVVSSLAYVGFGRYVRTAKLTEAANMLSGIRGAQEHYRNETGVYANVSRDLSSGSLYPAPTPGAFSTPWGGACTTCLVPWTKLDVKADAPLFFGYATVADVACDPAVCKQVSLSIKGTTINFPTINGGTVVKPWFIAVARGDVNGNGHQSLLIADSFSSDLLVDGDVE